jgi:hypothetical protein
VAELRELPPEKLSLMITPRPIDGEDRADEVECDVCHGEARLYFRCSICNIDMCSACEEEDNDCKAQGHTLTEPSDRVEVILSTPDEDIELYVKSELKKETGAYGSQVWDKRRYSSRPDATTFGRKCAKDPELLKRIPDVIANRAEGRFLFAKLYLDSLKSKQTLRRIQETLDGFPDDLDRIYEEALQRINEQSNRDRAALGMKVLSRVFCARRPLTLPELQHALAVEPGEDEFDEYMDYDKEDILASTAGLITIDADDNAVRFVHFTLQTFLDFECEKWIPNSETEMAGVCLTYLNYDALSEPCANEDFEGRKQEYPLFVMRGSTLISILRPYGLSEILNAWHRMCRLRGSRMTGDR